LEWYRLQCRTWCILQLITFSLWWGQWLMA